MCVLHLLTDRIEIARGVPLIIILDSIEITHEALYAFLAWTEKEEQADRQLTNSRYFICNSCVDHLYNTCIEGGHRRISWRS